MMVMIKSAPDTTEAKRAVRLAADLGADLVLIQNAVYLACDKTARANSAIYALDEDLRMRGVGPDADIGTVKRIDYEMLVDLISHDDRVYGAF